MTIEVLIAGAGQLGSRYLQGMAAYAEPLSIWVLDSSEASLARARQRWEEVASTGDAHRVRYVERVTDLPELLDLAVVATTADVRPELSLAIATQAKVENWIYEKVLAQDSSGLRMLADCVGSGRAWVNTPRHLWSLYRQLRQRFGGEPLSARFEGFQGLACNTIHYLDFVSRWNNADVAVVDTRDLEPQWQPAKREGFYEVEGQLRAEFSDGSRLLLASGAGGEEYKVTLQSGAQEWHVFEAKGYATSGQGERIEGDSALQSALTAPLMADIFHRGTCQLPTLERSVQQHEKFLTALLAHWHACGNAGDLLPIT